MFYAFFSFFISVTTFSIIMPHWGEKNALIWIELIKKKN